MPSDFSFPKTEEKILKFWGDRKIFHKTLENRRDAKRFVFFEGPPTANGLPGIHHFLGRVIKDLFARYKTMQGFYVQRKAGWDTHGLPVEIQVEKELGLKNKKEIEAYGIAEFNRKAKESVWKYKNEWERFTERIGFWLDLGHPYITYETNYIETLWWVIQEIDKKKLLYEGHKVLPWCPRCGTALSSHEVAQGYEDITETSVYVKFKLKPGQKIADSVVDDKTFILAWTTTPWTLPGNVALAVGKKIDYVITEKDGEHLIVAKDLKEKVLGDAGVDLELKGDKLIGLEYEPLFDIEHLQTKTAYKVYPADFVTTVDGTGIVHTAVMYGEDDYKLGLELGLPRHHTVDETGRFNKDVKEFEGRQVKEAEKDIIASLQSRGLLLKTEEYQHSYPFCWRCKSQLIYYARDSWFVAMSKLKKQLLKNNKKINWVPSHLKDGRFGEFIKDVKDWAFSRERYWGTPLPIWKCEECKEQRVVGSLDELDKYRYRQRNTYYLLRHGDDNRLLDTGESIIVSRLDFDKPYNLVPKGVEEIEHAAKKIKEETDLDMIFTSPFQRAHHSAEIVAKFFGLKVHVEPRLAEMDDSSAFQGKTDAVSWPNGRGFEDKHEFGESWHDGKVRVSALLRELDEKYEGKKILLVSHGDPLWLMEFFAENISNEEAVERKKAMYLEKGEFRKIYSKNLPYNAHGDLDMHRPYVDEIFLKCSKCEGKMKRVKEVADVWFDSGSMPFAQWHYPFENKTEFKNNFPAAFIAEGIDQTRGWFYTLLAVSTLLGKGAPYKNVVAYSHVLDKKGKKMSKSLGNIVDPWDIINQFGVDAGRWYFYSVNNPGDPKLFSADDVKKKMVGFMTTLFNSLRFYELYDKTTHTISKPKPVTSLDLWIFSRLNSLNQLVKKSMDEYDFTASSRAIESFVVDDLSNWWIRRSRERFQRPVNQAQHEKTLNLMRYLLSETSKILAPFAPFLADHIYKKIDNRKESVHLENWPKVQKKLINPELEKAMQELRAAVAAGLAQRKAKNIKVRQPLAAVSVKITEKFTPDLEDLLMAELNVKKVSYDPAQEELAKLDENLTRELILEGYSREISRQVQDMRKEKGYRLDEKVFGAWESDNADVIETMNKFGKEISETTLLSEFSRGHTETQEFDVQKEFELSPQIKIWLGVRTKK